MLHPDKWSETIDPFTLPFSNFYLVTILGYPHAGNDVFHVERTSKISRLPLDIRGNAKKNLGGAEDYLGKYFFGLYRSGVPMARRSFLLCCWKATIF